MARPKNDPTRVPTRTRILRAAEVAFGELGYQAANLADIAAAAEIRRPSLLYHFASKEALYEAVVTDLFTRLRQVAVESVGGERTYDERLHALVEGLTRLADEHPAVSRVVVRELVSPGPAAQQVAREFGRLIDLLVSFVTLEKGDPLPNRLPTRSAVMVLVASYLLRTGSPPGSRELFGPDVVQTVAARLLGD